MTHDHVTIPGCPECGDISVACWLPTDEDQLGGRADRTAGLAVPVPGYSRLVVDQRLSETLIHHKSPVRAQQPPVPARHFRNVGRAGPAAPSGAPARAGASACRAGRRRAEGIGVGGAGAPASARDRRRRRAGGPRCPPYPRDLLARAALVPMLTAYGTYQCAVSDYPRGNRFRNHLTYRLVYEHRLRKARAIPWRASASTR
jgi:hypothetical protein